MVAPACSLPSVWPHAGPTRVSDGARMPADAARRLQIRCGAAIARQRALLDHRAALLAERRALMGSHRTLLSALRRQVDTSDETSVTRRGPPPAALMASQDGVGAPV